MKTLLNDKRDGKIMLKNVKSGTAPTYVRMHVKIPENLLQLKNPEENIVITQTSTKTT